MDGCIGQGWQIRGTHAKIGVQKIFDNTRKICMCPYKFLDFKITYNVYYTSTKPISQLHIKILIVYISQ